MLEPDDRDLPRLQAPAPELRAGLRRLKEGRDALEAGQAEAAVRVGARGARDAGAGDARRGAGVPGGGAERRRDPGAVAAAQRATEINPTLVDGWRELGDAQLEAGALRRRRRRSGGWSRWIRPTGSATRSSPRCCWNRRARWRRWRRSARRPERGGDPFFIAAIRGDIYAEMERHPEAAEAYDQALAIDPEDHWALHQAALEHGFAGHQARASELFQAALDHDRDGCHQTLVDYGDHLRRMGRIGDAVKLYRRAVAAVPGEHGMEADAARGGARAARRAELRARPRPGATLSRSGRGERVSCGQPGVGQGRGGVQPSPADGSGSRP